MYAIARAEERTSEPDRTSSQSLALTTLAFNFGSFSSLTYAAMHLTIGKFDQSSQLRVQLPSQPPQKMPSQSSLHPWSHTQPSCRRSRALSTPPMMFVDSFDKRGESFDGSPQPLAEESIARTSNRLELSIAL